MEAMVGVAVLVNCALIGLSGPVHRLLPAATPAVTTLVIIALEVRTLLHGSDFCCLTVSHCRARSTFQQICDYSDPTVLEVRNFYSDVTGAL
jgi:hypothetical protein